MPNVLHWALVFTEASLGHLAERNIDAEDIADAVFGRYGTPQVRKGGRDQRTRLSATGIPEEPGPFKQSMRLAVSARLAAPDEIRSYRSWQRNKGDR